MERHPLYGLYFKDYYERGGLNQNRVNDLVNRIVKLLWIATNNFRHWNEARGMVFLDRAYRELSRGMNDILYDRFEYDGRRRAEERWRVIYEFYIEPVDDLHDDMIAVHPDDDPHERINPDEVWGDPNNPIYDYDTSTPPPLRHLPPSKRSRLN
jgi:hypothetical protein